MVVVNSRILPPNNASNGLRNSRSLFMSFKGRANLKKINHKQAKTDTSLEAERLQIQLLRGKTLAQRFQWVCSLSSSVYGMARRAIEKAHPTFSQRQRDVFFVKCHYGADLARRLDLCLASKGK